MVRCRLVAVMVVLLSLVGSICFASIPRSELALGGITIGASINSVQRIYGAPTKIEYEDFSMWGGQTRFYTYYYGNGSYSVTTTNGLGVVGVATTANNGISTPAGIKVGMSSGRLAMVYGEVNYTWDDNNGDKVFVYYENVNAKAAEPDSLQFTVRNGRIIKISLSAGILSI